MYSCSIPCCFPEKKALQDAGMSYCNKLYKMQNLHFNGQNPYNWSVSKSVVVAHQSQPSGLPASVHSEYHLPFTLKGNTQGAPYAFPSNVNRSKETK